MKRLQVVVLLAFVALPALVLAQVKAPAASVEQTLMDIEHRWAAIPAKAGDVSVIEAILAPNWSAISPEGAVQTRAQALERAKGTKYSKSDVSEMKVTSLSATSAVITGVWTGAGIGPKGEKIDTSERWTDVFVNQGGTWKCVASQSSTIKK
jgi:hypothetical protein